MPTSDLPELLEIRRKLITEAAVDENNGLALECLGWIWNLEQRFLTLRNELEKIEALVKNALAPDE